MLQALYPRFGELGFSGLLCFAHRQLAERWKLKVSWEEGMSFARSAAGWTLFEDAPGAMLYLRKFYRLLVQGGIAMPRTGACCASAWASSLMIFISLASDPLQDHDWLAANGLSAETILQVTRPGAHPRSVGAVCLICRNADMSPAPCAADYCINSMADLVAQHQLSLRR
nr:2-haloalkanoic acid dehalogenase [Pseudomonas brassicacearum subsp. brassicacearum]